MTKDRTQRDIPPSPPFKGGKSEAKGGCYPFKGGDCGSEALGKKGAPLGGGLKA